LENKPLLKSFKLKSPWPLEVLAHGLSIISKRNHLENLKIEANFDMVFLGQESWKYFQIFCDFLRNQKQSLKRLYLSLHDVNNDQIFDSLSQTLSGHEKLTKLKLALKYSKKYV